MLALSTPSLGCWIYVSPTELVQTSDLVVLGTLGMFTGHREGLVEYRSAPLAVEQVVWGPASPGDTLTLAWNHLPDASGGNLPHAERRDCLGLWLLTVGDSSTVRADYPTRFLLPDSLEGVRQLLRQCPVVLRSSPREIDLLQSHVPLIVSVLHRNVSDADMSLPGIASRPHGIALDPGVHLEVEYKKLHGSMVRHTIIPKPGSISQEGIETHLASGDQHVVSFDLRDIADITVPGFYYVKCTVRDVHPSNTIHFRVTAGD